MDNNPEIETNEPFYNCSECSSLIEIINLDNNNIEFKCCNKLQSHHKIIPINEYIPKMEYHHNEINLGKCKIDEKHNKKYKCYCLECGVNLCKICLKTREHLDHYKINVEEIQPKEIEMIILDKLINEIQNKKEYNNMRRIYEIIYNSYNKYNNNYYYCINIHNILINYIENNDDFINNINKEEYENIMKMKNKKEKMKLKLNYAKETNDIKEKYKINENKTIKHEKIIDKKENKIVEEEFNRKLSKIHDTIVYIKKHTDSLKANPKYNYYYTSENQNNNETNQISDYNRINPNLRNINFTKHSIDSVIVNSDDIIFIQNRIKAIHPKIKEVYFNLVYRASEDGDKASDFHKKCDTIGPNVSLIKTRKGNIFGGFTFKNWEHLPRDIDVNRPNLGSASRDTNAFGFNVNNQKIYNNEKPNEFAIWCNRNFGPTFKNNLFQIFDSCFKKGGYCGIRTNSNFGGQMYDYEISGGEPRFKVDELEVFEVRL